MGFDQTNYVERLEKLVQDAHQRIGLALTQVNDGSTAQLLAEALAALSGVIADCDNRNRDDGKMLVAWEWSTEHGHCYDCNSPAAYALTRDKSMIFCSVCAAWHAATGEQIESLFNQ